MGLTIVIGGFDIVRAVNIPPIRIGWDVGVVEVRVDVDSIICDVLTLVYEVVLRKVSIKCWMQYRVQRPE